MSDRTTARPAVTVSEVEADSTKSYALPEWAADLEFNRNKEEWSDAKITSTQWQEDDGNFNETVLFDELVLYVAVQYLSCPSKEFFLQPPYPISQEFNTRLMSRVDKLIHGKGFYIRKDKPDDFRVLGIETKFTDAHKPYYDLYENPFPNISNEDQKAHVIRGIRNHLGDYADSFSFESDYEIRSYSEAKKIFVLITEWKKYLNDNNITKESLTKASNNNYKGYKAMTVTELKKTIKLNLNQRLNIRDNTKRKSRIISRATELILK